MTREGSSESRSARKRASAAEASEVKGSIDELAADTRAKPSSSRHRMEHGADNAGVPGNEKLAGHAWRKIGFASEAARSGGAASMIWPAVRTRVAAFWLRRPYSKYPCVRKRRCRKALSLWKPN